MTQCLCVIFAFVFPRDLGRTNQTSTDDFPKLPTMMGVSRLRNAGTCIETASIMVIAQKTPIKAQNTGIKFPVGSGFVFRYPNHQAIGYVM